MQFLELVGELAKVTPGGVEDMRSQQWHDLAHHYVQEISTNGC